MREVDFDKISCHGQIPLALLPMEYLLVYLKDDPGAFSLVQSVLKADWAWTESRSPSLNDVYWDYMELIHDEHHRQQKLSTRRVFDAIVDGQYAFLRTAEGIGNLTDPKSVNGVGSDVGETDDSLFIHCLEACVAVSPNPGMTDAWLDGLIARVTEEFPATDADVIGPPIRRSMFQVPSLAGV